MEKLDSPHFETFKQMYLTQLQDLLAALNEVEELMKKHLAGASEDVLKLERFFKQT